MTARQIEGEFETVVEVLRAAGGDQRRHRGVRGAGHRNLAPAPLTFAGWDRAADGVAGLFDQHGVTRGSVVCLMLPSSIDYMVCYAAAARLGAGDLGDQSPPGVGRGPVHPPAHPPMVTVVEDGADPPAGRSGDGAGAVDRGGGHDGPAAVPVAGAVPTDPVAVVWTSGTTGLPKGAVFDHASLAAVAAGTDVLSEPGDRRLSPLPFAHVGSMTRPWDEIANGVTTVITPTPWKAADAIRIMDEERITVAQGVPTQWALVLAHPDLDAADVSSLRIAGPVPRGCRPNWWRPCGSGSACRWWCATPRPRPRSGTGTVPGDPDEVVATRWDDRSGRELAIADDAAGRSAGRRGGPGPTAFGCGDAGLLGRTPDGPGGDGRGLRPGGHPGGAGRRTGG